MPDYWGTHGTTGSASWEFTNTYVADSSGTCVVASPWGSADTTGGSITFGSSGGTYYYTGHAVDDYAAAAMAHQQQVLLALDEYRRLQPPIVQHAPRAAQAPSQPADPAVVKARALLNSMLSLEQRAQYEQYRYFDVISRTTRTRYRVHAGVAGNIERLDDQGRPVARLCCHLSASDVPEEDHMVMQRLFLEHNEAEFVRTANITPIQQAA